MRPPVCSRYPRKSNLFKCHHKSSMSFARNFKDPLYWASQGLPTSYMVGQWPVNWTTYQSTVFGMSWHKSAVWEYYPSYGYGLLWWRHLTTTIWFSPDVTAAGVGARCRDCQPWKKYLVQGLPDQASSRSPSTSQAPNLHFAMGLLIMQGLSHSLLSFSVPTWPSRHVIENHL